MYYKCSVEDEVLRCFDVLSDRFLMKMRVMTTMQAVSMLSVLLWTLKHQSQNYISLLSNLLKIHSSDFQTRSHCINFFIKQVAKINDKLD